MNKQQQERWIDDALRSLEGAERLHGDPELYTKVMAQVRQNNAPARRLPLVGVAAVAALLLIINIASVLHFAGKTQGSSPQSVSQVINDDVSTLSEGSF